MAPALGRLVWIGAAALSLAAPPAWLAGDGVGTPDPAAAITADEIQEHVDVLASDVFEGREAGTLGERRAAGYLIAALEEAGLQPGGPDGAWEQEFGIMLHGAPAIARNVLARLPGSDPELAGEAIVVGAHYDHVGRGESGNSLGPPGEVHNGADDNASGSAVLLDLATSLAGAGWKPRRTILFQWYSGEELGLLGSRHWVEHPTHPIGDVVFMVNMDMVGRLTGRTLVVGGTGTSAGLAELAAGLCEELGLVMIDDPPGTAPSDNSSFYEKQVPALFLFTGLHDDYHQAGDDSHLLNATGAADVGRLAQGLVAAIDARDERPVFQRAPGNAYLYRPRKTIGAAFALDLSPLPVTDAGTDAGTGAGAESSGDAGGEPGGDAGAESSGDAGGEPGGELGGPRGLLVEHVVPEGPADAAGLLPGDLLVALDGQPVEVPWAVSQRLKRVEHDLVPMTLTVLRRSGAGDEPERLELVVRPALR